MKKLIPDDSKNILEKLKKDLENMQLNNDNDIDINVDNINTDLLMILGNFEN